MSNRVVITASGVISSHGNSISEIAESFSTPPTFIPSRVFPEIQTCPVDNFQLKSITGRNKNLRYLNRGAAFSLGAAYKAVESAQLTESERSECGVFIGAGPNLDMEGEFPMIHEDAMDWEKVPALWILKFLPNTAASLTAQLLGLHGENLTITTACSATLQAIGEAFRKIKHGYLSIALAGGGDSRLSKSALIAYKKAGALFAPDQPEQPYIPFSNNRKGFIPGEGGAVFLLENLEHARARNARILGEICGYGASLDGHQMTAPDINGVYAQQAVQAALKEANTKPGEVDLISTHGTGTELNDQMEATMLERVFKSQRPWVTAFKSRFGHLSAACGAVELAAVLGCMEKKEIPGIPNLGSSCSSILNFVKENIPLAPKTVLLENFGFGGQNSALIVKQWTA